VYLNDESNSELVFLDKCGNTFFKIDITLLNIF